MTFSHRRQPRSTRAHIPFHSLASHALPAQSPFAYPISHKRVVHSRIDCIGSQRSRSMPPTCMSATIWHNNNSSMVPTTALHCRFRVQIATAGGHFRKSQGITAVYRLHLQWCSVWFRLSDARCGPLTSVSFRANLPLMFATTL